MMMIMTVTVIIVIIIIAIIIIIVITIIIITYSARKIPKFDRVFLHLIPSVFSSASF